jgi:glycosyltransferase involved in cell wall biosynthesis
VFLGHRCGAQLAQLRGASDVLVFPSLTDTFGLAMIEALAWGVPVAAFPVPGPEDVIGPRVSGVLRADLGEAIAGALPLNRHVCAARAGTFSWEAATSQFLAGWRPLRWRCAPEWPSAAVPL